MAEIDPSVCPVCGEQNACGLSQGKSECWCFGAEIEQAALARVPSEKPVCARAARQRRPRPTSARKSP
jgi:hypothetical protein